MCRSRWIGFGSAVAVLLARPCSAETVKDLYVGEAHVTGQAEPERARGFHLAIRDALVKVTGIAGLAEDPRVAALIREPAVFVASYSYTDKMADIPLHDEQGTCERPYTLRVRLEPSRIDALLAALGATPWSADRPLTLVDVEIAAPAGTFRLRDAGAQGYGQRLSLIETASRHGVPILLPSAAGDQGSRHADGLLQGRMDMTDHGTWRGAWRLVWKGVRHERNFDGVSFDEAFRQGVAMVADACRQ